MILGITLLALAQGAPVWTVSPAGPAVGDTIHAVRLLPGPPGTRARPGPLPATNVLEPLGDPRVVARGDRLLIGYDFTAFEPGEHAIAMPAVELLYADGTAETVVGDTARVRVRSVLPPGDSLPAPRPSLGPLARDARTPAPLITLVGVVVGSAALWAVRRRRTRPRPPPRVFEVPEADPSLARWVGAGELRAAAAATADRLRRAVAGAEPRAHAGLSVEECLAALRQARPEWPLEDFEDTLRALERARFAPAVSSDVLALADQVTILIERIA